MPPLPKNQLRSTKPAPNYLCMPQPSRLTPNLSTTIPPPIPPTASSSPPRSTVYVGGRNARPAHNPCTPQLKRQTASHERTTKGLHYPPQRASQQRSHRPPPWRFRRRNSRGQGYARKSMHAPRICTCVALIDAPRFRVEGGFFCVESAWFVLKKNSFCTRGFVVFGGGSA